MFTTALDLLFLVKWFLVRFDVKTGENLDEDQNKKLSQSDRHVARNSQWVANLGVWGQIFQPPEVRGSGEGAAALENFAFFAKIA